MCSKIFASILFVCSFAAQAASVYEGDIDLKAIGVGTDVYRLQVSTDLVQTAPGKTEKFVWKRHLQGDDETQYFCETLTTYTIGQAHVHLVNTKTGQVVQSYDLPIAATVSRDYEVQSQQSPCRYYWPSNYSEDTVFYFDFKPIPVGKESVTVAWYFNPTVKIDAHFAGSTYNMVRLAPVQTEVSIITHWGIPTHTHILPMTAR